MTIAHKTEITERKPCETIKAASSFALGNICKQRFHGPKVGKRGEGLGRSRPHVFVGHLVAVAHAVQDEPYFNQRPREGPQKKKKKAQPRQQVL